MRAVDQVVVHQGRQVDELDCDARDDGRRRPGRCGQVHQQRSQPLAAGGERLRTHLGDDASIRPDRELQPLLQVAEVPLEAWGFANLGERAHTASAVWSATMPPAKSRTRTLRNPAAWIISPSSSGPGKRRTLAGRYVYADPPGSSLPSSGTTPSNHKR